LERWDKGWCRLYRTIPLVALTPALLDTTCALLTDLILAVQPLCADWWADYAPADRPRPPLRAGRAAVEGAHDTRG
jgi:hypothetical protein